jgi:two-component system, cell cycle response regulator DivK
MVNNEFEYRGYRIVWEVSPIEGTDYWKARAEIVLPPESSAPETVPPIDGSYFANERQAIDYVIDGAKEWIDKMVEGKKSQGRMKKILIVEDHPHMRRLLMLELSLMGFEIITANNGREGVEKALAERPDLILLDFMLPEMDGWEAARSLRACPETKDIPIVAETALFRQPDLNSCLQAGCDDYLVKPFTYKDLEKKLRALI